jgi:hypothetical protein
MANMKLIREALIKLMGESAEKGRKANKADLDAAIRSMEGRDAGEVGDPSVRRQELAEDMLATQLGLQPKFGMRKTPLNKAPGEGPEQNPVFDALQGEGVETKRYLDELEEGIKDLALENENIPIVVEPKLMKHLEAKTARRLDAERDRPKETFSRAKTDKKGERPDPRKGLRTRKSPDEKSPKERGRADAIRKGRKKFQRKHIKGRGVGSNVGQKGEGPKEVFGEINPFDESPMLRDQAKTSGRTPVLTSEGVAKSVGTKVQRIPEGQGSTDPITRTTIDDLKLKESGDIESKEAKRLQAERNATIESNQPDDGYSGDFGADNQAYDAVDEAIANEAPRNLVHRPRTGIEGQSSMDNPHAADQMENLFTENIGDIILDPLTGEEVFTGFKTNEVKRRLDKLARPSDELLPNADLRARTRNEIRSVVREDLVSGKINKAIEPWEDQVIEAQGRVDFIEKMFAQRNADPKTSVKWQAAKEELREAERIWQLLSAAAEEGRATGNFAPVQKILNNRLDPNKGVVAGKELPDEFSGGATESQPLIEEFTRGAAETRRQRIIDARQGPRGSQGPVQFENFPSKPKPFDPSSPDLQGLSSPQAGSFPIDQISEPLLRALRSQNAKQGPRR